jgi:hypothetical protein
MFLDPVVTVGGDLFFPDRDSSLQLVYTILTGVEGCHPMPCGSYDEDDVISGPDITYPVYNG